MKGKQADFIFLPYVTATDSMQATTPDVPLTHTCSCASSDRLCARREKCLMNTSKTSEGTDILSLENQIQVEMKVEGVTRCEAFHVPNLHMAFRKAGPEIFLP